MIRSTPPRPRSSRPTLAAALIAIAPLTARAAYATESAARDDGEPPDPRGGQNHDEHPALPSSVDSSLPRREIVFALGYGLLVAPRQFVVYGLKDRVDPSTTLGGITVDVTRRSSFLEYGARFFTTGGTSDHAGTPAHILTQTVAQVRIFPWSSGLIEPWAGATLGVALADDFTYWDKTETERAHAVVGDTRVGWSSGLEVGARCRVARLLALSARGGAGSLGFSRHPAIEHEIDGPKYTLQPTDYGRRAWVSLGVALELTVPN